MEIREAYTNKTFPVLNSSIVTEWILPENEMFVNSHVKTIEVQ